MNTIELSQGKVALVDDIDKDLAVFNWCVDSHGYAVRKHKGTLLYLHRVILERMGVDMVGKCGDHTNRIRTDNRRSNLRAATSQQNSYNRSKRNTATSKYKGVSWHKSSNKWSSYIRHHGKLHWLGTFESEHDAARAYNVRAKEWFGEFATQNEIGGI